MKKSIEKTLREEAIHSLGIEPPSLEEVHRKAEMSPKNPTSAKKNVWAYLSPVFGAIGGAAIALAIALPLTLKKEEVLYGTPTIYDPADYGTYAFGYVSFCSDGFVSPIDEETTIVFEKKKESGPGTIVIPAEGSFEGSFTLEGTSLSSVSFSAPYFVGDLKVEATYLDGEKELALRIEATQLQGFSDIRLIIKEKETGYDLLDTEFYPIEL